MNVAPPFQHTSGPRKAKLAIVGEAWGREEEITGKPFVGQSGQELTRLLKEAGISRGECFLTNVLACRPPNNNLDFFCSPRKEVGAYYDWPPIAQGKFLRPEHLPEITRLKIELQAVAPNLVLAAGGVAAWALLRSKAISSIRGAVALSTLVPPIKVLPTYHPAAIFRKYNWRPIVVADLVKARREMEFPEIQRPNRDAVVNPTLDEIEAFWQAHRQAEVLSIDIETQRGQITMIGFAPSPSQCLVIPFWDLTRDGGSYWPTEHHEKLAWLWVERFLNLPATKLFQNGLFDLQYIMRMGFRPKGCRADSMLLSHAIFPEMPKGLGFLGSIYTNEPAWKLMRHRSQEDLKRDE